MKLGEYREQWKKEVRAKAMKVWVKMKKDFDAGMAPEKIAEKYINPRTKKPYTRVHVYEVLRILESYQK